MKYCEKKIMPKLCGLLPVLAGLVIVSVTHAASLGKLDMAMIKSDTKAVYEILKNKNDKLSLFRLAKLYLYHSGQLGMKYEEAQTMARKTLIQASKKGHKDALFEYAINFEKGPDASKAIEKAASQGSGMASLYLGTAYYFGKRGKKKNYQKAKHFFQMAAKAGQAKAFYHLGIMYNFGHGVNRNPAKAASWYNKALAAGYFHAYLQLGKLYATSAKLKPRNILDKISIRFYQKKYDTALPKLVKLADSGNVRAQYILGAHYIADRYKAGTCGKAQKYLYLALKGRHPGVRDRLTYIHSRYSVCK